MKSFELKKVDPIDKFTFRIFLLKSIIFQVIFIVAVQLIMKFKFIDFIGSLGLDKFWGFIGLAIIYLVMMRVTKSFDIHTYRARYKDIYPEEDFTFRTFILLAICPPVFIALNLFFCLANGSLEKRAVPLILKPRYFFFPLAVLYFCQSYNFQFAYWTAQPVYYHVLKISNDAATLFRVGDRAKTLDDLKADKEFYSDSPNSARLALSLAIQSKVMLKDRKREIDAGADPKEISIKYGVLMAEALDNNLKQLSDYQLHLSDYSVMQWMCPNAQLEILLLAGIEDYLAREVRLVMLENAEKFVKELDVNITRMPASDKKDYYVKKVENIKQNFNQARQ